MTTGDIEFQRLFFKENEVLTSHKIYSFDFLNTTNPNINQLGDLIEVERVRGLLTTKSIYRNEEFLRLWKDNKGFNNRLVCLTSTNRSNNSYLGARKFNKEKHRSRHKEKQKEKHLMLFQFGQSGDLVIDYFKSYYPDSPTALKNFISKHSFHY